jgi:hypothetical protein
MMSMVMEKLKQLTQLGITHSKSQQDALVKIYEGLMGFIESAILCFRNGPMRNLQHEEWAKVEKQYEAAIASCDDKYNLLKELQDIHRERGRVGSSFTSNSIRGARYRAGSFTESPTGIRTSNNSQHAMMPARSNRYYPRPDVIKAMRTALDEQDPDEIRSLTLHGLGGVGKTEVAREYAHQCRATINTILWIRSDSSVALNKAFSRAATWLNLPNQGYNDASMNRAMVLSRLQELGKMIIHYGFYGGQVPQTP